METTTQVNTDEKTRLRAYYLRELRRALSNWPDATLRLYFVNFDIEAGPKKAKDKPKEFMAAYRRLSPLPWKLDLSDDAVEEILSVLMRDLNVRLRAAEDESHFGSYRDSYIEAFWVSYLPAAGCPEMDEALKPLKKIFEEMQLPGERRPVTESDYVYADLPADIGPSSRTLAVYELTFPGDIKPIRLLQKVTKNIEMTTSHEIGGRVGLYRTGKQYRLTPKVVSLKVVPDACYIENQLYFFEPGRIDDVLHLHHVFNENFLDYWAQVSEKLPTFIFGKDELIQAVQRNTSICRAMAALVNNEQIMSNLTIENVKAWAAEASLPGFSVSGDQIHIDDTKGFLAFVNICTKKIVTPLSDKTEIRLAASSVKLNRPPIPSIQKQNQELNSVKANEAAGIESAEDGDKPKRSRKKKAEPATSPEDK